MSYYNDYDDGFQNEPFDRSSVINKGRPPRRPNSNPNLRQDRIFRNVKRTPPPVDRSTRKRRILPGFNSLNELGGRIPRPVGFGNNPRRRGDLFNNRSRNMREKRKTYGGQMPSKHKRPPSSIIFRPDKIVAFNKIEDKKSNLILEFFITEKDYISNLNIMKTEMMSPSKAILDKKTYKQIFGSIEMIIPINQMFVENLSKLGDNIERHRMEFFNCVMEFSHCFKLYIDFILKYETILKIVHITKKKNKKFNNFLKKVKTEFFKRPEIRMKTFESFLILPIQRIPRYKLLIENLLKESQNLTIRNERQHEELELLKKSFAMIKNIAGELDEKKKLVDLDFKIKVLDNYLNIKNLIQPWRHLLKEKVYLVMKYQKATTECNIYLFSDIFVVLAFHVIKKKNFKLQTIAVVIKNIKLEKKLKGGNYVLIVRSSTKTDFKLEVSFENENECDGWIADILGQQQDVLCSNIRVGDTMIESKEKSKKKKKSLFGLGISSKADHDEYNVIPENLKRGSRMSVSQLDMENNGKKKKGIFSNWTSSSKSGKGSSKDGKKERSFWDIYQKPKPMPNEI